MIVNEFADARASCRSVAFFFTHITGLLCRDKLFLTSFDGAKRELLFVFRRLDNSSRLIIIIIKTGFVNRAEGKVFLKKIDEC